MKLIKGGIKLSEHCFMATQPVFSCVHQHMCSCVCLWTCLLLGGEHVSVPHRLGMGVIGALKQITVKE